MGECIICGAEIEGADICSLHEEDVLFTFTGDRSHQLVEGRYYEGTVDGFADFGVFVDLGNNVNGLLHRNELDQRLESLGWDVGDAVVVQVTNIRDDGNVDLGPSIRQTESEFRGSLTQSGDDEPAPSPDESDSELTIVGRDRGGEELDRSQIRSLDRYLGRNVALEGVIQEIRQTGGPTVLTLEDESGTVECAAFAGAGVRAYPDLEAGDAVRIRGKVEHRFDDHQVEVEGLDHLSGNEAEAVHQRVADSAVVPDAIDELGLLYDDAANLAIETDIREGAAALHRAIENERPIRIRHPVSVDGYVAAAAIERAVEAVLDDDTDPSSRRSLVRRLPVEADEYGPDEAIHDVDHADGTMPFVLLVGLGRSADALVAFELLAEYDIDYHIIDSGNPEPVLLERVSPLVNPWCGEGTYPIPTTTSTACNVAGLVAESVRDDLAHLPSVAAGADRPETASRLLEESPFTPEDVETMRQAVTLEAFYQPWGDKRALIRRILFERESGTIEPISEQFTAKLDRAVDAARYNATVVQSNGSSLAVLDAEAYGQRFEFPPLDVLLAGLVDDGAVDAPIAVGVATDYLEVTGTDVDLLKLADALEHHVDDGGIAVNGGADGRIRFLSGRRDEILEAIPEAVATAVE